MDEMAAYCDDDFGEVILNNAAEDMSDVYQPFLLHVPRHGLILDAGCGSGRDSLYFTRHGYDVVAFEPSAALYRFAGIVLGQRVCNQSFESVRWISEFDGVWVCNSLQVIPWASIDSIFEKLAQALKPEGVMLVSLRQWGPDWETSPFVRGCDERNLMQLIRKHAPSLMLDAIWVSNTSLNALLFRR